MLRKISRCKKSSGTIGSQVLFHRCSAFSALSAAVFSLIWAGCASTPDTWRKTVGNDTNDVDRISRQLDNPNPPIYTASTQMAAPVTALSVSESEVSYSDVRLDEVLQRGLQHSTVLRDIGGAILRSPDSVTTGFAKRLQETDPRFGMEAALSSFDAQLAATATFNNNDRVYNNNFFAGGATAFQQDQNDYQIELSKRTATGSRFALRGVNNYDNNNAPANTFASSWNSWIEGEVRQPLLQGAGLEFNRIAGPGSTPGVYNGVLIAKANADINSADFALALRDYVSNVENSYWDLYLAYRELDARKKAMEQALVIWKQLAAMSNSESISRAQESLARQQYYQLKSEVDEALSGRLVQGTQVRNGATGGTLQIGSGVLVAERRLRLLIGMSASDGILLRPSEEPTMASVMFDWDASMQECLTLRPEMQRQNANVRKREMELLAARNFLNPQLDAIGRYRFRGFGDELIGSGNQNGNSPASSLGNLATGDQQEWTMGVELMVPIGYRKAHAAVDHAELALSRERVIYQEQEREVLSHLSGSIADTVRAYQAVQNNLNQYLAAEEYFNSLNALRLKGSKGQEVDSDRLLDAQRRLVQSEIQFFRSRAEYAVSLKNVHYEKGSLLDYKDMRIANAGYDYSNLPGNTVPGTVVPASPVPDHAVPPTSATKTETPSDTTSPAVGAVSTIPDEFTEQNQVTPVSGIVAPEFDQVTVDRVMDSDTKQQRTNPPATRTDSRKPETAGQQKRPGTPPAETLTKKNSSAFSRLSSTAAPLKKWGQGIFSPASKVTTQSSKESAKISSKSTAQTK
jgi:outer membrane protein TolC